MTRVRHRGRRWRRRWRGERGRGARRVEAEVEGGGRVRHGGRKVREEHSQGDDSGLG